MVLASLHVLFVFYLKRMHRSFIISPNAPCLSLSPTSCFAVGGMDKKRVHYVEGGQCGNREHKINNLIRCMN